MFQKDITSMRGTIEFLKEQNMVLEVKGEVDPIYEIAGIQKAFENGPVLLFKHIKGYPNVLNVANVFSRTEIAAKIFDVADPKKLKFKGVDAIRHPIPPKIVEEAPCQEVIRTNDIDVRDLLPVIKHTPKDGGRVLGGGVILLSGRYFREGHELTFKRVHFRGKDWGSMLVLRGSHLGDSCIFEHSGEKVPVTVNIGVSPAALLLAGCGMNHVIIPPWGDELAIAGGLQGSPVEIVKAKTVDAYAIANSEWVIEGYIDVNDRVWESDEAEKIGRRGVVPFFPEYTGYLGRAFKVPKFKVTGITYREDNPIFYTPLARSYEGNLLCSIFNEACYYELADRLVPGLVQDVHIFHSQASFAGVVFQVKKRRRSDEGYQRTILSGALNAVAGLRVAIVVDEDVDIYSADDVMWAITTRVSPMDIVRGVGGAVGQLLMPGERNIGGSGQEELYSFGGGIGMDATVPFEAKWGFERGVYPVDRIDLRKWFSEEEISGVRAIQDEYAKLLSKTGW